MVMQRKEGKEMKKAIKLIIMNVIFVWAMGGCQLAYESDRLVDIPVPPNSSGYADFTSEEGEQKAKEYEQNKEKNQETKQETTEKEKDEKQAKERNTGIIISVGAIIILGAGVGIYKISQKKSKKVETKNKK